MDNNGDFTYKATGIPAEQDKIDVKQLASHVGGITIKDEHSNGYGNNKGLLWKDKLPDNTSKKQVKVGSLSYNVIDASAPKQSSGLGIIASGDAGTSAKSLPGQKIPAKKPASRAKVPFEKGYNQMEWFKLTRTHPDLAGLKGQPNKRIISMNEVKQHKTECSMWTVLKGRVYNITPYMKFHPGGDEILKKAVGRDCTLLFNKYHAWVNYEFLLEKCLVGTLDDSK